MSPSIATPRLSPPEAVVRIARRLEGAGFETWCVGGAVRDALLGLSHLDWDLATAAPPQEVRRLFRRTVPVGIEHGTVGVMDDAGRLHEVTTFRADVETDGRHAVVRFGVSLDEDLARRDFTINAIAWSPLREELRDPFDGQGDLARGLLRAVGAPAVRMAEDRLRALRAIRFAARFGFVIDEATWAAIVESAPHLTRLSMERVRQEWVKTLEQVPRPSVAFAAWRRSGALRTLLPALDGVAPLFFDAIDEVPLPGATRRAEREDLRRLVRLALPFLPLGERLARQTMSAIKSSNREMDFVATMARAWSVLSLPAGAPPMLSPVGARRAASAIGKLDVLPALRCAAAVWRAATRQGGSAPSTVHTDAGPPAERAGTDDVQAVRVPPDRWARMRRMADAAWRAPIAVGDLAVDGEDLRAAGIAPGPALGRTLRTLLDDVLEDPARNTRETLLARLRELAP